MNTKPSRLKPSSLRQRLIIYGLGCVLAAGAGADELEKNFVTPPDSAKADIWWHWMDGSVTKEGITADLEAMRRVGIGSVQMFNLKASPLGPVKFLTPEWREMLKFAGSEAARLGLKLSIHNCAGWSSSGGPWNTPENAMQRVVISETVVTGGKRFSGKLPQPATLLGFYRDIEVLAVRRGDDEDVTMRSLAPKATAGAGAADAGRLIDGKAETLVTLPMPGADTPQFVQLEFSQPFLARSAVLQMGPGNPDVRGVVQASADGREFHELTPFVFPRNGGNGTLVLDLGAKPAARFYRIMFTAGGVRSKKITVAEIALSPAMRIGDIEAKSGMNGGSLMPVPAPAPGAGSGGAVVKRDEIIDLTSRLQADGRIDWDAPPGRWTILRIGHTPIGKDNHPAADGGLGLECDKLSTEALDAHWAGYVQKVLDDLGPLAGQGRTFDNVLIDSYEIGGQNWTPKFREEFRRRRGYDLLPFLVTFTGRVVDSPEISERFLWDMRRTIADLFAEKYYAHFQKLCHERGLTASIEPYTGPFESLQVGAAADIPMGEFWAGNFYSSISSTKLAASVGHVYDRRIIGAESFTAFPTGQHGRWLEDPRALKALGDLVFCQGVNRFTLHRYAMQPWTDRWPGMTMGHWGTHFDRTVTWFEQGRAWLHYVARSQYLLQQGRFVADAACFSGENAPMESPENGPALPPGYDYDAVNADLLLKASVRDGRLVLAGGMSYRVLLLPPEERTMTPALLRKLRELVADGLTVVGAPPLRAPGLTDYPRSDGEVRAFAAELWGNCDGRTVTEHALGRGKVVWGQPMDRVLAGLNVPPDFGFKSPDRGQLAFIHRRDGDTDVYFVSHQRERFDTLECTFRVSGKVPELWYPDTGRRVTAGVWREQDGRTTVSLPFDPAGSVFVVFRRPTGATPHLVAATFEGAARTTAPARLEIRHAVYETLDGSGSVDVTAMLQGMVHDGALRVEAGNVVLGRDPGRLRPKQLRVEYLLDGKCEVQIVSEEKILEIGAPADVHHAPAFELFADGQGRTRFRAATPGSLEWQDSTGQKRQLTVRDVPAPIAVTGPWQLDFPPNWGAPAQVKLPELISWSEHADNGVRYFSGTATYRKEVEIPPALLGGSRPLWLNLGEVKNLAEVFVNGQPLGVLWKPPFRVDIAGAARAGGNTLEIRITNLWPNRLIGDEQLPADREWGENNQLKSWPQWLLDGKPSPTGRFTFTTWRHWKKDDALLPSGLLGPVTLQPMMETELKP